MRILISLCSAAMLCLASIGFALPKVSVDVLSEVRSVDQVIKDLEDYESRFWAIGLNGDTLHPDAFHKFFIARGIEFRFFVRSLSGVSLGDATAYQENRQFLYDYRQQIIREELTNVERVMREMMQAQQQQGAVGLTGDVAQTDAFVAFFSARDLDISYYVKGSSFTLGDASAYDQNLQTLREYAQKLRDLDVTSAQ